MLRVSGVAGLVLRVWCCAFGVARFGSRFRGLRVKVSNFGVQVSGFGFWVEGDESVQAIGLGLRVFRMCRVSGAGFSMFGFRV